MQTTIVTLGLILALLAFIHSAMNLNEAADAAAAKVRAKTEPKPEPQIHSRQSTRAAGTSISL